MTPTKLYNTELLDMEGTIISSTTDYPVFTVEEELDCARRMKTADTKAERNAAREEMILHNMRLVISCAKKYYTQGMAMAFPDLVQEGLIGLMTACDKFDAELGYKFSTYATWWIKQAITRAMADKNSLIRTPVHIYDNFSKIRKFVNQFEKEKMRTPKAEEVAKALHMDIKYVNMYFTQVTTTSSLDTKVGDDEDSTRMDYVEDKSAESPENAIIKNDENEHLLEALDMLTEKEKKVIIMRYGLDGNEPMTLEQVGVKFGVTRERIRQIQAKGLNKLRTGKPSRILRGLR